jgi:hypothetical protein
MERGQETLRQWVHLTTHTWIPLNANISHVFAKFLTKKHSEQGKLCCLKIATTSKGLRSPSLTCLYIHVWCPSPHWGKIYSIRHNFLLLPYNTFSWNTHRVNNKFSELKVKSISKTLMSRDKDKSKKTAIKIMNNIWKPKETTLKTKSMLATRTRCTGRIDVLCFFLKHPPSFSYDMRNPVGNHMW